MKFTLKQRASHAQSSSSRTGLAGKLGLLFSLTLGGALGDTGCCGSSGGGAPTPLTPNQGLKAPVRWMKQQPAEFTVQGITVRHKYTGTNLPAGIVLVGDRGPGLGLLVKDIQPNVITDITLRGDECRMPRGRAVKWKFRQHSGTGLVDLPNGEAHTGNFALLGVGSHSWFVITPGGHYAIPKVAGAKVVKKDTGASGGSGTSGTYSVCDITAMPEPKPTDPPLSGAGDGTGTTDATDDSGNSDSGGSDSGGGSGGGGEGGGGTGGPIPPSSTRPVIPKSTAVGGAGGKQDGFGGLAPKPVLDITAVPDLAQLDTPPQAVIFRPLGVRVGSSSPFYGYLYTSGGVLTSVDSYTVGAAGLKEVRVPGVSYTAETPWHKVEVTQSRAAEVTVKFYNQTLEDSSLAPVYSPAFRTLKVAKTTNIPAISNPAPWPSTGNIPYKERGQK